MLDFGGLNAAPRDSTSHLRDSTSHLRDSTTMALDEEKTYKKFLKHLKIVDSLLSNELLYSLM